MSESIPDPVRAVAATSPDAPAIIAPNGTVSYAELDRHIDAVASGMRRHSLGRGDRLGVYRPVDEDYLVLLLAACRAGVVACPLNTRQPPIAAAALLKRIDCDTLDADPVWDGFNVIDLACSPEPRERLDAVWRLDTPATILFTSGSTGEPKAVLHTLGNHVASALGSNAHVPLGPGDRWLLDLPLYHVGGLAILFRCMLAGATVVLPQRGMPLAENVAALGVTHLSLVATQLLRALQNDSSKALGEVKAILLGGSAVPPGLVAEAHALGLPVHTSYGMTEMSSTITATPPGASLETLSTSGVALPNRDVKLADNTEILVRGNTLFAGYVEGDTLASPTDVDGWFHTGDLGEWVEIGGQRMLRVVGRTDHLFISGGENVQPEEIEAALGRLPGVRQSVVVPIADEEFGQRPVAFVDAEVWAPETWREALGEVLARYKIPDAFYPWPDEDRIGMKVDRAALRKRAGQGRASSPSSPSDHIR